MLVDRFEAFLNILVSHILDEGFSGRRRAIKNVFWRISNTF